VATDLKPAHFDRLEHVVTLDQVEDALDEITRGGVTGRYVVNLQG
jgi:D-arabinose 1-dehydrogenase-like Zn-dependent alcohol dehydrogenase